MDPQGPPPLIPEASPIQIVEDVGHPVDTGVQAPIESETGIEEMSVQDPADAEQSQISTPKAPFLKKGRKKPKNRRPLETPVEVEYPEPVANPPRCINLLQDGIGYTFRDTNLLREAITHSSAAGAFTPPASTNQRLEFLGDAVLELIISTFLFSSYPEAGEGALTKSRAHLVNKAALFERAENLQLGQYIIMSRAEESNGGRRRTAALVDCFEALVGAIYLDGGYYRAEEFVEMAYEDVFSESDGMPTQINPKGELQEILQKYESTEPPRYEAVNSEGPEHEKTFECIVSHQGIVLARGSGKSKKIAETRAAEVALHIVRDKYLNNDRNPDIPSTENPSDESSQNGPESPLIAAED